MPFELHTDCRSPEGVTIGLIDSIITLFRVLKDRDLSPSEVQEALLDMRSDEDIDYIWKYAWSLEERSK
jgi:hypothetical protein